jgi:hypothetical protein
MTRQGWYAIFAGLLLVLPASRALGSPPELGLDGSWWSGLSQDQRTIAVAAEISAFAAGAATTEMEQAAGAGKQPSESELPKYGYKELARFTHTIGYYRSAIDNFYATHDTPRTPVSLVLSCLQDKALFSCDQVARIFAH